MVRSFLVVAALVASTASRAVAAESPQTIDRPADKVAATIVRLRVFSDDPAVSGARVSGKLASELHLEVALEGAARASLATATVTISWRPERGELAVSFSDASGRTVSRIVEAPKTSEAAIAAATQLAANLAGNEAAEILGPPKPIVTPAVPAPRATPPRGPRVEIYAVWDPEYRPVVASLFAPLSTSPSRVRTNFELNLLYGRVWVVDGAQLGVASVAASSVDGLQFGYLFAYTRRLSGLQIGGATSLASRDVRGVQLASALNYARDVEGWQSSFLVNAASGDVKGVQTAAANVGGNFTGLQIGGVNVAKKVRGVQLGLINVSDEGAVPIGLFNVSNDGGIHPMVWSSWRSYLNVGVKFATRHVYSILNASMHRFDETGVTKSGTIVPNNWFFGPGAFFGVQFPAGRFRPFIDVGAVALLRPPDSVLNWTLVAPEGKLRVGASFEIAPRFRPMVGLGVTSVTRGSETQILPDIFGGFEF